VLIESSLSSVQRVVGAALAQHLKTPHCSLQASYIVRLELDTCTHERQKIDLVLHCEKAILAVLPGSPDSFALAYTHRIDEALDLMPTAAATQRQAGWNSEEMPPDYIQPSHYLAPLSMILNKVISLNEAVCIVACPVANVLRSIVTPQTSSCTHDLTQGMINTKLDEYLDKVEPCTPRAFMTWPTSACPLAERHRQELNRIFRTLNDRGRNMSLQGYTEYCSDFRMRAHVAPAASLFHLL
jgi:hypothetical protein